MAERMLVYGCAPRSKRVEGVPWRGGLSISGKLQMKIRVESWNVWKKDVLRRQWEDRRERRDTGVGHVWGTTWVKASRRPHLHTPHCRSPWPSLQWGAWGWVSLQLQSHSVCNSTISSSEKPRARSLRRWGSEGQRVAWRVTRKFT